MNEGIGYVVVVLLIIGFVYALVRQIKHTLAVQNSDRTVDYKTSLFGNYLTCIAMAGFLISFVLNLVVSMQFMQSSMITSNNTSASCFIFLAVLFIAKFTIVPKNPK
jgi:dihydroxyacetone kinase